VRLNERLQEIEVSGNLELLVVVAQVFDYFIEIDLNVL